MIPKVNSFNLECPKDTSKLIINIWQQILWCHTSEWCFVIQGVSHSRCLSVFKYGFRIILCVCVCVCHSQLFHVPPGGTMGTSLDEMQRSCLQKKARLAVFWYGRAKVSQVTLSSQFSPMRRNMSMWTARPRWHMWWYATRWDKSVQAP